MALAQAGKRPLDVEDVVRWACAPSAAPPAPPGRPLGPINLARHEASLVGRWAWPMGYPQVSPMFAGAFPRAGAAPGRGAAGPPDADAMLVRAAVDGLAGALAEEEAPEILAAGLGFAVDLAGAFAAAAANLVNLTLIHGRLARRPALVDGPPRCFPRAAPNGKPGAWRLETWEEPTIGDERVAREVETPVAPIRGGLYPVGAYGRLDWDPDPQAIVNDRADYLAWRLGLDLLAERLTGALERIAVLAPAAALAPWLGEADGLKPPDLFARGARGVYSRRAALAEQARREARERRRPSFGQPQTRRPARPGKGSASA